VRHHAGDFAGATSDALLAVSHNKTIHNHTCFWFNNLILYMNMVFTHHGAIRQCSNAQEAKLFTVNLWQINLFHSGEIAFHLLPLFSRCFVTLNDCLKLARFSIVLLSVLTSAIALTLASSQRDAEANIAGSSRELVWATMQAFEPQNRQTWQQTQRACAAKLDRWYVPDNVKQLPTAALPWHRRCAKGTARIKRIFRILSAALTPLCASALHRT
jgi:hypothetical protein